MFFLLDSTDYNSKIEKYRKCYNVQITLIIIVVNSTMVGKSGDFKLPDHVNWHHYQVYTQHHYRLVHGVYFEQE